MRKRIKIKKLNRSYNQRKALFKNLIVSLIEKEEITTTKSKAKAIRSMTEKLITKGKVGSLHATRQIQSFLQDKNAVKKIVDDLSKRFKDSKGGYLKITSLGNRRGDNAPMVKLSLAKLKEEEQPAKKSKTTKSKKQDKKEPKSKKKFSLPTPKKDQVVEAEAVKQPTRKVQKKG